MRDCLLGGEEMFPWHHGVFSRDVKRRFKTGSVCAWIAIVVFLVPGCRSEKRVEVQRFDVSEVTRRAMKQLDRNSDGQIDREEMKSNSALLQSRRFIDRNDDGLVSGSGGALRLC